MESIKKRLGIHARISLKTIGVTALALAAAVLLIWVCISTSNASNMRRKYAETRRTIGDMLYGSLDMMAREYDGASLMGADVEGSIIPSMRNYYIQSKALNNAIAGAYGQEYQVMDGNLISELDQAFSAYDDAFKAGRSTDTAATLMTTALIHVRDTLDHHYDSNTQLMAR